MLDFFVTITFSGNICCQLYECNVLHAVIAYYFIYVENSSYAKVLQGFSANENSFDSLTHLGISFNYKIYSQVFDYNLKILNVNARLAGSTNDAFFWRHSILSRELQIMQGNNERWSLLADSGYPLEP